MKVIATAKGFFGSMIEAGQTFEVPNGTQASWFRPIDKSDEWVEVSGGKAGKSSTTTKNVDAIASATK